MQQLPETTILTDIAKAIPVKYLQHDLICTSLSPRYIWIRDQKLNIANLRELQTVPDIHIRVITSLLNNKLVITLMCISEWSQAY